MIFNNNYCSKIVNIAPAGKIMRLRDRGGAGGGRRRRRGDRGRARGGGSVKAGESGGVAPRRGRGRSAVGVDGEEDLTSGARRVTNTPSFGAGMK